MDKDSYKFFNSFKLKTQNKFKYMGKMTTSPE